MKDARLRLKHPAVILMFFNFPSWNYAVKVKLYTSGGLLYNLRVLYVYNRMLFYFFLPGYFLLIC